jgi:hypothetical protein
MNRNCVPLLITAGALFCLCSRTIAGILMVPNGISFTPDSSFTNNTIALEITDQGALIHLTGGATVVADPSNPVTITITGSYYADTGDLFSGQFTFTADLGTDTPIDYTLSGSATVLGLPVELGATGTLTPGLHEYQTQFQSPFVFPTNDAGDFSVTLTLHFGGMGASLAASPGTFDFTIGQIDFRLDSSIVTVEAPSVLQNISTRGNVGTDEEALIGGFIIIGTTPKTVVLRAIGPSINPSLVADVLDDPSLELHDSGGGLITSNDNWVDLSQENQTTLINHGLAPTQDAESALVMTLDPGLYTAIVRGVNDTTGVGLVEAYDLDDGTPDSMLANLSTRGSIGTGEDVLIGGVIVGGGGGGLSTVVLRGIGPSLAAFGILNPLADPFLELHNSDGAVIASNDNWMDDANMQQINDAGLAPTDLNESAIFEILPAGLYTAILSGVGGTIGVGPGRELQHRLVSRFTGSDAASS